MEKTIERYFVSLCKKHGWQAVKLVSNNFNGLPDRLVLKDDGTVFFAELKNKDEKPRKLQSVIHKRLCQNGFRVYVIDGNGMADYVIREEVRLCSTAHMNTKK